MKYIFALSVIALLFLGIQYLNVRQRGANPINIPRNRLKNIRSIKDLTIIVAFLLVAIGGLIYSYVLLSDNASTNTANPFLLIVVFGMIIALVAGIRNKRS